MNPRLWCVAAGLAAALAPAVTRGASKPASPLGDLLTAAGAYLAASDRGVSAIVAEEDYVQVARETRGSPVSRRLRSDFLVMNLGANGWIGFRDVFEVDGRPVRDRQERLAALFLKPGTDVLAQARGIALEGARFNLSLSIEIGRTINTPMTALGFLRAAHQSRSAFRLGGTEKVNGRPCVVVRFVEQAEPRLLATDDGSPGVGAFWLEPTSGRVERSELVLQTARAVPGRRGADETLAVSATIRVDYGEQAKLGLWLPISMDEHYDVTPRRATIDGHASYAKFRQFQVDTGTIIKAP